jgi:hypothetical protein
VSNARLGEEKYPKGQKYERDDQAVLFCQNILLEEKIIGRFPELTGHRLNNGIYKTDIF